MKNEFCQPGSQWVIVRDKPLRIRTRKIRSIPKALAYFIVQILRYASNQSEFIVKRCMALIEILNHEPIDVGLLIAKNIKYMANRPQQDDLCRLVGVSRHPNDDMVTSMLKINQSVMRRIPI